MRSRMRGRNTLSIPATGPIDFDVYPDIHKRSIRLIGAGTRADASPQTVDFVRHRVDSGRLNLDV